jgi:ferric iron reductase protein FhuF
MAPVTATLAAIRARHGDAPTHGFRPEIVSDTAGWTPASALISGEAMPDLLAAARQRWQAQPHVAAALAWKCYTYWLALPAALGYTTARRVPLMYPENVLVRFGPQQPFLTVGLRRVEMAVRADDPIAANLATTADGAALRVVPDDAALRAAMRHSLVDQHLTPLLERLREHVHIGRRTLWGSLASGVAHGLSRASDAIPGPTIDAAHAVLTALDVDDLVDLDAESTGELRVQRRTCCLAFTLPEPKVCRGCCIRAV